jgi:hypothetical protein
MNKNIKKEGMFIATKVNIFKVPDGPEYREALRKKDFEAIKKLATFRSQKKNVIPVVGREQIGKILSGHCSVQVKDEAGETWINKCALGTSSTPFTENSTKLGAEAFRKNVSSASYSGKVLRILSHYLPEDISGNFREEGVFINGTDEKDSGVAFSLINLSAAEGDKSSLEALLIERVITFNIV